MTTEPTAKKKQKKGSISEEDISIVLQRYPATTVLSLLQEVANWPGSKIDWNALVKKTSTGISDAREYQMLWRHLAYCDDLVEKLNHGAEPLDDDSDLEFELEASPAINSDAATEAATCVKALIASGLPSDSNGAKNMKVEAPFTTNVPNGQSCKVSSENPGEPSSIRGRSSTAPVSVQKLPQHGAPPAEGLDANGNMPPRKRKKPWSKTEDRELIAAVQKCGEGNWEDILKGDFKGDRTATQLSQRWAVLRKKDNLNVGSVQSATLQLSESQLATRRAITLALSSPSMKSGIGGKHNQTQQATLPNKPPFPAGPGSNLKTALTPKTSPPESNMHPDTLGIHAAAVKAGARRLPSDAASVVIAAQANKAVHIHRISSGGSQVKSSSLLSGPSPSVHHIAAGPPRRAAPVKPSLNTRVVSESTELPLKQEDITNRTKTQSQEDGGCASVKPTSSDQVQRPSESRDQAAAAAVKNREECVNPSKMIFSCPVGETLEQGVNGNGISTSDLPSLSADKESSKMVVLS